MITQQQLKDRFTYNPENGYMVRICIGTYKSLDEAAKVYEEAIRIYHGQFARAA